MKPQVSSIAGRDGRGGGDGGCFVPGLWVMEPSILGDMSCHLSSLLAYRYTAPFLPASPPTQGTTRDLDVRGTRGVPL